MTMEKTPLYKYPAVYARENDELEQYRASHKANIACKAAIEAAIAQHYTNNSLGSEAMRQVAGQFGYERTMYVLANTVKQKDWDGRFSGDNKRWARTIPVFEDIDGLGTDRCRYFVVDSHAALTDLFLTQMRRQQLLETPLTRDEVKAEAARLLALFQDAPAPNSPSETHYMAQISPDFLLRASSKQQDKLFDMLPFASLTFGTIKEHKGIFAMISSEENRNQRLQLRKPSVRDKLQKPPEERPPTAPKKKEVER